MSVLEEKLQQLKKEKKLGLMTHLVIGYPSLEMTVKLAEAMVRAGADMIELQIPFSDPVADGPVIMQASEEALKNGTKVKDAFTIAKQISEKTQVPVLFMGYYNTVFQYGVEKFCVATKASGVSGLIIPDIPLDEEAEEHFIKHCKRAGVHHIRVVSPESTDKRLRQNAEIANGFVYCTARQGITGVKDSLDPKLVTYLKKLRKIFSVPLAVGFGISKPEHIRQIKPYADLAIVGSAVIQVINQAKGKNIEKEVEEFCRLLKTPD